MRLANSLALTTAALLACAAPASSEGLIYELKAGVLGHDVPDLWSGFQAEHSAPDINLEVILRPSYYFLGGAIRPAIGGTINTRGDTSHGYIDARWQYDTPFGFYVGLGLGAAIHNGEIGPEGGPDHKWLGSRVLFHIPAEIGYRLDTHNSVSVYFEHTSNAYTATYNEGMDRIGIRYGYRF